MKIWGVVTHRHNRITGNKVPSSMETLSLGIIVGRKKPIKTHMCREGGGDSNGRVDMPAMCIGREKRE